MMLVSRNIVIASGSNINNSFPTTFTRICRNPILIFYFTYCNIMYSPYYGPMVYEINSCWIMCLRQIEHYILLYLFLGCVDCVGTFKETRDKGAVNGGYDTSVEETLAECQELCIFEYPYCLAVEYKNGTCSLFSEDEYRADELIENVGNIHSVLVPC